MVKQIFVFIFFLSFSMKSFALDNYYKMLGIPENATQDEVKKGYRRMAMKYHPDKHGGSLVANEIFKKVKDAYDVLSDPKQRAMFDRQLSMQPKVKPAAQAQPQAKAQARPTPQPQAKPAPDNAKKYTWENFDQKKDAPKEQAKAEPKAQPKPEAAKANTYEFKEKPKTPNPTPGPTFNTENTAMTNTEKAFKGDTSVVKPAAEARTPFKNPKLDMYNSPGCTKGFMGTVIDTLI